MGFMLHSIGLDDLDESCVSEERNVEFQRVIGAFEEGETVFGDAGGLAGLVEVLGDHFEEGRLAGDAELVAEGGGEEGGSEYAR